MFREKDAIGGLGDFFHPYVCCTFREPRETELKAIGFLPKDHKLCAMIPVWIDTVNTELKGR